MTCPVIQAASSEQSKAAALPISAGVESLEVSLFAWQDIPWPQLAFPSVAWALNHDLAAETSGAATPFFNPAGEDGNMEMFTERAGVRG